ncbi:MAG TPA: NUDIX domain-containing protein [Thermomicrobiaceae bacterium]|nr:NUDIX domain-containing protein [Thermomicrobiaceae bacterium]
MERLWTPWRMRYVGGGTREPGCIFCTEPAPDRDVEKLILYRGASAFVIMNLFPYNTGHLMAVPFRHAARLDELEPSAIADLFGLLPWVTAAQQRVLRCDGFNIGLNLGSVAGAGVAEHLHVHVVPRWEGDANFMPILANTMVLPELIPVTYAKLRAELELSALDSSVKEEAVPQAGAVVLLPAEGKVALRRAADGSIVLPKGHVESGEAAFETARREVEEEMGLRGEILGWAGSDRFTVAGRERRAVYLTLAAEPTPAFAAHLDRDALLAAPDEAPAMLSHPTSREVLRAALSRFSGVWGAMG